MATENKLEGGKDRNKEYMSLKPTGKNGRIKNLKVNKESTERIRQGELSRNGRNFNLNGARKEERNEMLLYGSYNVGNGKDIDPKEKLKPTRDKQNLNFNKATMESFNKKDVKRNKNLSSIEERKRKGIWIEECHRGHFSFLLLWR